MYGRRLHSFSHASPAENLRFTGLAFRCQKTQYFDSLTGAAMPRLNFGGFPQPPKLCASTCAHSGRIGKGTFIADPKKHAFARRLRRRQDGGGFPFPFEWRLVSSSSRYLS